MSCTYPSKLTLHLNVSSIWAELHGSPDMLDNVEYILKSYVTQAFGVGSGMPWLRVTDEVLRVMAGLVPWALSDDTDLDCSSLHVSWDDEGGDKLNKLTSWGWRDYQVAAVQSVLNASLGRGIVSVGTGGGKTRIAWGIVYAASEGPWCYVVHGRDLVRQAGESFAALSAEFGVDVPIYSMGWSDDRICSRDWAGIIVDECHQVAARSRAQVLASFQGTRRVGLSGTPIDRTDKWNAMTLGLLGDVCYHIQVEDLTESGFLTPGRVVFV